MSSDETPSRADQNERTALAWNRTALSVVVTAAIVSRFGMESIGPFALLAIVAALPVSGWLLWAGSRRYRGRLDWQNTAMYAWRDGRFEFAVTAVVVIMLLVLSAAIIR